MPFEDLSSRPLSSDHNSVLQKAEALGSVYKELLASLPGAIAGQLQSDFSQNRDRTLSKMAETALTGIGSAVLLSRSPVFARALLGGLGLGTGVLAGLNAAKFSLEACSASTAEKQARLVAAGRGTLGRLGADMLESTPALLAGAAGGRALSSRVPALESLSLQFRQTAELRARQILPENFHYLSFDSSTAGALGSEPGALNLYKAGRQWLAETPWRGVEEGRFFKLSGEGSLKASGRITGSADRVYMGRSSRQIFHTHESNILPSSGDFNSVYGSGIIGLPREGILTFYDGSAADAQLLRQNLKAGKLDEALSAAENLQAKPFSALVLDPRSELSLRVDLSWNPAMNRLEPQAISTLDFADTVKNLSKWQGRLNIDSIGRAPEALLKPGMTDLLRKIRAEQEI